MLPARRLIFGVVVLLSCASTARGQTDCTTAECCSDREDACEDRCDEQAGCTSGSDRACQASSALHPCCSYLISGFDGSRTPLSYGTCLKGCQTSRSDCIDRVNDLEAFDSVAYRCGEIEMSGCAVAGNARLTPYRPRENIEENDCTFRIPGGTRYPRSGYPIYSGKDAGGNMWYVYYGYYFYDGFDNVNGDNAHEHEWVAVRPSSGNACIAYREETFITEFNLSNDLFEDPVTKEATCLSFPQEPYRDSTFSLECVRAADEPGSSAGFGRFPSSALSVLVVGSVGFLSYLT